MAASSWPWFPLWTGVLVWASFQIAPPNQYIGAEACGTCHEARKTQHSTSPHGTTWRPVSILSSLSALPTKVVEADVSYSIEPIDGKWSYVIQIGERPKQIYPIHSVIGGSRFGYSFLYQVDSVESRPLGRATLVEGRWMLDIKGHLKISPGFPAAVANNYEVAMGRVLSPGFAEKCLSCHLGPVDLESALAGRPKAPYLDNAVSCERCHGPGGNHVEAVADGAADLRIVNPAKLPPRDVMKICGGCHSGFFQTVRPRPGDVLIASQAQALERSECYVQSDGGFSCATCHDPHRAAAPDPERHEAVCLGCHGDTSDSSHCPVNPKSGCIPCHMPKNVQPGSFELIDHWIRVPDE